MSAPPAGSLSVQLRALIDKGVAAMNTDDGAAAEAAFREACELAPADLTALHNLGLFFFREKRLDEAEEVLIRAAKLGALPPSVLLLASVFKAKARHADAVRCLEALLKARWDEYTVNLELAELKGLMGDAQGQCEAYRRCLLARPADAVAASRYADVGVKLAKGLFAKDQLGEALALLEQVLSDVGDNLQARMSLLPTMAEYTEWHRRRSNGEPPYHASHVGELFFRYGRTYVEQFEKTASALLERKPASEDTRLGLGVAKFCLGDRAAAEALIRSAPQRTLGTVYETVKFSPEYYDTLRGASEADLTRGLPPLLTEAAMPGDPNGIVYLACNFSYFHAFALPMVTSLRDRSPGTPVHLHVMDATPQQAAFILVFMKKLSPVRFALTVERPGLTEAPTMEARCYYHAVRFIRLYEHLKLYNSPLWLMDVDAIINRDLQGLMRKLGDDDVAVRVRPGRLEPWNQFNACLVGVSTSARSREYFRLIAAYVADFHERRQLRWGIDQQAMYGVYANMEERGEAPRLKMLGPREVDYDHESEGYIWPNSGGAKMHHMQRIQTPGAPPPRPAVSTFEKAFEHYWQETAQIARTIGVNI